jgi:hypothetical protein
MLWICKTGELLTRAAFSAKGVPFGDGNDAFLSVRQQEVTILETPEELLPGTMVLIGIGLGTPIANPLFDDNIQAVKQ